jgi:DNA polymerase III alpha subunit (gram-positive type)
MTMKVILENWRRFVDEAASPKSTLKNKSLEIIPKLKEMKETLDNLLSNSIFIFFDTETTGLSGDFDQITELAYGIFQGEQLQPIKKQIPGSAPDPENSDLYRFMVDLTPQIESRNNRQNIRKERANKIKNGELSLEKIQKPENMSDEDWQKELDKTLDLKKKLELLDDENLSDKERTSLMFRTNGISQVLQLTHYEENKQKFLQQTGNKNISEEQMLKSFWNLLNSIENKVVVAHNASFDIKMITERPNKYPGKITVGNLQNESIIDTIKLAKVYVPALQEYKNILEKELNEISHSSQTKIDEAEEDIERLKQQIIPMSDNPVGQRIIILQILLIAVNKSLQYTEEMEQKIEQKFSYTLGNIAKTINIDPSKAHQASEDVKMLVSVFKHLRDSINMLYNELTKKI